MCNWIDEVDGFFIKFFLCWLRLIYHYNEDLRGEWWPSVKWVLGVLWCGGGLHGRKISARVRASDRACVRQPACACVWERVKELQYQTTAILYSPSEFTGYTSRAAIASSPISLLFISRKQTHINISYEKSKAIYGHTRIHLIMCHSWRILNMVF